MMNMPTGNSFDARLPMILATLAAIIIVLFSQSVGGHELVTVFALLLTFLTFFALLNVGPILVNGKLDIAGLTVKLLASLAVGVLMNVIANIIASQILRP